MRAAGPTPSSHHGFQPPTPQPNVGYQLHQVYSSWSDSSGWFGVDTPWIEAAETPGPDGRLSSSATAGAALILGDREEGASKQREALEERILFMCESR